MNAQGSRWRVVKASAPGLAHLTTRTPCQDHHRAALARDFHGRETLIAAVADGAGFAIDGALGARTAVLDFVGLVARMLARRPLAAIEIEEWRSWFEETRAAVLRVAGRRKLAPRDVACTFAAAAVAPDAAFACQIGDGVIALRGGGSHTWSLAFLPQKGEHRNETRFLTDDDASAHVLLRRLSGGIDRLALGSDGVEDLCLEQATQKVFGPFLDGLSDTLLSADGKSCGEIDAALERYLRSDAVNAVTDDDKTLVLAVAR